MKLGMLLNRDLLNKCFNELAKIYKKANRRYFTNKFEIIIVGGSAIVEKYNFRLTTSDVDADCAINKDYVKEVARKLNIDSNWLNNDFKRTESYSPRLSQYSIHYRDILNILSLRIVTREYLIAMKLKSFRSYKNDLSDIIGILKEESSNKPIELGDIKIAVSNLYGNYKKALKIEAREFIEKIIAKTPLELDVLYNDIIQQEKNRHDKLLKIEKYSNGKLNEGNVNTVIKNIDNHKSVKEILKQIVEKSDVKPAEPEINNDDDLKL